jgi:hypothetical protein
MRRQMGAWLGDLSPPALAFDAVRFMLVRDLQNSSNKSNFLRREEKKDAGIAQKAGRSGYRSMNLMPAHEYYPESGDCPKIFCLARRSHRAC